VKFVRFQKKDAFFELLMISKKFYIKHLSLSLHYNQNEPLTKLNEDKIE